MMTAHYASTMRNLLEAVLTLKPTHENGGTLDLVIAKTEQVVTRLCVDQPNVIADHSLIRWMKLYVIVLQ